MESSHEPSGSRKVLECGSPLPLSITHDVHSGRGLPHSKTLPRQSRRFCGADQKPDHRPLAFALWTTGLLLGLAARIFATEDPPNCSVANGGAGNTSSGGINFAVPLAHIGDTVSVFPSLGMVSNACRAINATGSVYIATGRLTNFLQNVTLDPSVLISCPANPLCQPGPYNVLLTPIMVGAPVKTPVVVFPGLANRVRVAEYGYGTVLAGQDDELLADAHVGTLLIVRPCIQVFKTCDLLAGQSCFSAATAVRFWGYVTNCGDITLTNVTVVDDRAGQTQLFDPTNGSALTNNVTLPPGAFAVFSNSFLPTVQEICAGAATNVTTATARDTTPLGGPNASVTNSHTGACEICFTPAIAVTKTCPPAAAPGGLLTFSGTVTNTGSIALTNVTVTTDRRLADGGHLVVSFPTVAAGEVRSFTGSYVVPTNACAMTDTLTAQGTSPCGSLTVKNSATATCAVTNTPRLELSLDCPLNPPAPGQPLLFTGTVTNRGDVAVTNIVIVNHQPASNATVAVLGRLEPDQGTNFNGSFLAPSNVCSVADLVTATGFDVCGTAVTTEVTRTCAVTNPPPTITCATNKNVVRGTAWNFDSPTATSAVGSNVSISVVNTVTNVICGDIFIATRTWRATDVCGGVNECSQVVTVIDQTPPVLVCSSNLVFAADLGRCSRSNVTFFVSATDNCGVTNLVSSIASGSTFPVGTTTVTNTATDASGNTASCIFTVTVTDTQNPLITCPGNLVLAADPGQCGRSSVSFYVSATDNCRVTNLVSIPPSDSPFPVGVTTVTNIGSDASGNTSTCTFTVTIADTQNATVTCPSSLLLPADPGQCSRSNVTFSASAADNCGVTNQTSSIASGSTFPVGTTTVTNTATDASGNISSCTFTVTVTDTQNPVIICPSNLVLTADAGLCGRDNVSYVVSATDNCAVTNLVISRPSGSFFPVGMTIVTNTATDASGNTSSCTFTVTVSDNQSPFIFCPSNLLRAADPGRCSRSNITFSVGAADNCRVTNIVSSPPSGSTFLVGTTTVTSTATDGYGNQSSCTFTVTVTDTQNATLTCPSNLLLPADPGQCSRSNVTFSASATDNCSVTNISSSIASGSTFPLGTTTVTNTATDASGNRSTCTFTVTVTDTQNPILTCPSSLTLAADAGYCSRSNVTFTVTAMDNCAVTNLVSVPPSGSTFAVGTSVVTNTATDSSGNSSICTFPVTVLDQESPAITCPPDVITNTAPNSDTVTNVALGTPLTSDNCAVAGVSNNAPAIFPLGTNVVLWTATDTSGNNSSCEQRVVVVRGCSAILNAAPPDALTVCQYQPVSIEVNATSPEPISYRWEFNGQLLPDQTNRVLSLPYADLFHAGEYSVQLSTLCVTGEISTTLTVVPAPASSPMAYTNPSPIRIDEFGESTPYGSPITLLCVPGVVQNLTVSLFGLEHPFSSDVSVVLASPQGRQIKLMGGAGGQHGVLDVNLTFSDAASRSLPANGQIVSGIYLPTDYEPGFLLPPPANGPYYTNLAAFNGDDPNGTWRLFVYDDVPYDGGWIGSWSLELTWREQVLLLQHPKVLTNGAFQAEVLGQTGILTVIERSSDLVTWLPVATNVYFSRPGLFTDPAPLFPYRYYRAWQP